jgi:predicted metalloprotease with PDZ domain
MLLALLLAAVPADSVRYDVSLPNVVHHEARIVADFPAAGKDTLEVWMSRASPGRYALHEFAKNVYDVSATDAAGHPLTVVRRDPYRWLVVARGRPVRFAYTLFADLGDGTYSQIDPSHAHLNMPATFAWARGLERRPVAVRFSPPEGSGWRVATQLIAGKDSLGWAAPDLAYFMDSPTEVSAFALRSWTVAGAGGRVDTIRLALHHQGTDAELDAYAEAARKVVAEQVGIFGETALYDHHVYTFLADYLPWVAGDGMEHRNSTVLTAPASLAHDAPRVLRVLSHEFFHSWNMERIRSAEIEPFDFTRANPSHGLWFGEGFTNYYDRLAVRRAGLITDSVFGEMVATIVNDVVLAPGRRFFSPMEMSLQAPFVDAASSIDPTNQANTFLSYYTWGSGVALGLDLTLRGRFQGKNLDGYMRLMWERFGRPKRRYTVLRLYTVDDLQRTLGAYSGDSAFARDFFAKYVRGRDVPDYAELLEEVGMQVRPSRPEAGFAGALTLESDSSGAIVTGVTIAGTPLYEAGVDLDDLIVSAGGTPIRSQADWDAFVGSRAPGDEVPLVLRRRGREMRTTLRLVADRRVEVVRMEQAGKTPTEAQRARREAWLRSRA